MHHPSWGALATHPRWSSAVGHDAQGMCKYQCHVQWEEPPVWRGSWRHSVSLFSISVPTLSTIAVVAREIMGPCGTSQISLSWELKNEVAKWTTGISGWHVKAARMFLHCSLAREIWSKHISVGWKGTVTAYLGYIKRFLCKNAQRHVPSISHFSRRHDVPGCQKATQSIFLAKQ